MFNLKFPREFNVPERLKLANNLKEFIKDAKKRGYNIILFGGPDEILEHEKIYNDLIKEKIYIYRNNPHNSKMEFASLVDLCNFMVCADSFALHIALGLKKQTVALFFVTSADEIEDYGILKKIVSPMLKDFFPERMNEYSKELTGSISSKEVLNAIENFKNEVKVVNAIIKNSEGKFLIIKRDAQGLHQNKWAFPGGVMEKGETTIEALEREILEETGLKIKRIVKKISEYKYKREDGKNSNGTCFLIETKNFDVKPNEEVQDFKWIIPEELGGIDFIEGLDDELLEAM